MSSDFKELVKQLLEDAKSIERLFTKRTPSPGEARAFLSPVMRRWICHNSIDSIIRKLDSPDSMTFEVMRTPSAVEACRNGAFELWTERIAAGGLILFYWKSSVQLDSEGKFKISAIEIPRGSTKVIFKDFREQNMLFWKGRFFKRDQIIKFFADTQGGTHYGVKDSNKNKELKKIRYLMSIDADIQGKKIYVEPTPGIQDDNIKDKEVFDYFQILVVDSSHSFMNAILNNYSKVLKLIS